ncbi:MAG: zinc ribbon domain-containing protein [Blastocatellia bacterium]
MFAKIRHVGSKHGIKVESVDARNTSRTCHKCGHCEAANRKSQTMFVCVRCGHKSNADFNASLNVRDRRAFHGCGAVTRRPESAPRGRAKKAALL